MRTMGPLMLLFGRVIFSGGFPGNYCFVDERCVRCAGPALRGEACTSEAWYCRASAPHTPVTTKIIITIKTPSVAALGSGFAFLLSW